MSHSRPHLRQAIALVAGLAVLAGLFPTRVAADPVAVFIHDVQGSGFASPLAGTEVTVEAVVVGDFQGSSGLRGFFLQEEDADADLDPDTSEGIFVFDGSFGTDVDVADGVRVTGTVRERFGETQIASVTEVTILSSGETLPAPASLDFPLTDAEREAVEGMRVEAEDLYVTDTFNLHRFGEVWLGSGGVIEQPTNELPAGPAMEALAEENMLRSILLDDGWTGSNPDPIPYLNEEGTLRLGDRASQITAVMSFGFSAYRLHPVEVVEFESLNPRPEVPDVGGDVTVASFNVLNYWTTIGCGDACRGAQTPEQLAVQTDKLVTAIIEMDADVVALQEIENPVPAGNQRNPFDPSHTPITTLVDALNKAEGSAVWAWVGPASHYNDYPIRNEIIYRIGAVVPVGQPTALAHEAFDAHNPVSGDAYGRPPLAQRFQVSGAAFTVVVNHLKSKGTPCLEPNEGLDGQGNCNLKRVEEAEALLEFVAQLQRVDGDVLVVGDMNAYMEEDPILTLETELTNLVTAYDPDPYSYNFFALFAAPFIGRGSLDHALATPSMAGQVTGTATWHINADEPRFLDWFDPSITAPGAYRSSDHDPVLIGLALDRTAGRSGTR